MVVSLVNKFYDECLFIRKSFTEEQKTSMTKQDKKLNIVFNEFKKNKVGILFSSILILLIVGSILAPLTSYSPSEINPMESLQKPSRDHILGTDSLGRDYFTRILYGGRISLLVGFSSMVISTIFGTFIGLTSGFLGGIFDSICMRLIDVLTSLPTFLIMIIISTLVGPSIKMLIILISLFSWMRTARIVRAETLAIKERDFLLAARALGTNKYVCMTKHILPNILPSIIVTSSMSIASAILMESSLSYLGLGVKLPMASWGSMLQEAQQYILDLPFLAFIPGFCILCVVCSFNILGDILRSSLVSKNNKSL